MRSVGSAPTSRNSCGAAGGSGPARIASRATRTLTSVRISLGMPGPQRADVADEGRAAAGDLAVADAPGARGVDGPGLVTTAARCGSALRRRLRLRRIVREGGGSLGGTVGGVINGHANPSCATGRGASSETHATQPTVGAPVAV